MPPTVQVFLTGPKARPRLSFTTKSYKVFVFSKNISPEEIGKVSVLVRASDVETRLRGDFELCTPSPPKKGTLVSTSECIGTTQKRTKTFADGMGGNYIEEIVDTGCPVQIIEIDTTENVRSTVTLENTQAEELAEKKRLQLIQEKDDANQLNLIQALADERKSADIEKEKAHNRYLVAKQKEIDDEAERISQQRASNEESQKQQYIREQEEVIQKERFLTNQRRRALAIKKQEEDDEEAAAVLKKQQAEEQAQQAKIVEEQRIAALKEQEALELALNMEEEENQRIYAIKEQQEIEDRNQRATVLAQQREEQRRIQEEQQRVQTEFQASQRVIFEEEGELPYSGPSKKKNVRVFLPEE